MLNAKCHHFYDLQDFDAIPELSAGTYFLRGNKNVLLTYFCFVSGKGILFRENFVKLYSYIRIFSAF